MLQWMQDVKVRHAQSMTVAVNSAIILCADVTKLVDHYKDVPHIVGGTSLYTKSLSQTEESW